MKKQFTNPTPIDPGIMLVPEHLKETREPEKEKYLDWCTLCGYPVSFFINWIKCSYHRKYIWLKILGKTI